jgi:phosphatidylserine/phosphatidylglycerophosphate/cardiolipin synthase-like enzyme
VFDRKDVFIGSFNLDARSPTINTEAGLTGTLIR